MDRKDFTLGYVSELINNMLLPENNSLVYGYTLVKIPREICYEDMDKARVSTAAIFNNPLKIVLNAEFMSYFTKEEQIDILKHEILHYANRHFDRFNHIYHPEKTTKEMSIKEKYDYLFKCHIANIAMDCSINQFLKNIPKDFPSDYYEKNPQYKKDDNDKFITLGAFKNIINGCQRLDILHKVKEFDNAETYYNILMEVYKNSNSEKRIFIMSKLFGNCCSDCGSDMPGTNDIIIDIDDFITKGHQDIIDEIRKQGGNISSELEEIIKNAIKIQKDHDTKQSTQAGDSVLRAFPSTKSTVDKDLWKKLIDHVIGIDLTSESTFRYGRPNRKNEDSFWYKVRKLSGKKVYIIWDTSGSMCDEICNDVCGYLSKSLQKYKCEATLIFCDGDVTEIPRKITQIPKNGLCIKGRGGTDLTKGIDWIEKNLHQKFHKSSDVFIFTDGCTPWRKTDLNVYVIYTKDHEKINPVKDYAVLNK